MVNYAQSKIYMILSDQTNKVYVGSTTMCLLNRLTCHKRHYKKYLKGQSYYDSVFEIIKYRDAYITLIENFPCTYRFQLLFKEKQIIASTPNAVNNHYLTNTQTCGLVNNEQTNRLVTNELSSGLVNNEQTCGLVTNEKTNRLVTNEQTSCEYDEFYLGDFGFDVDVNSNLF